MALHFIEGFGQFQGQSGAALLSGLVRAGYAPDQGIEIKSGRHPNTYALELQVSPGSAGQFWSKRTNGIMTTLNSVAHGGNLWVAVGGGGEIHRSEDTITWVPCASPVTSTLNGVIYANDMWVAVGVGGVILTSFDGRNWVQEDTPSASHYLYSVAGGDGSFIAVGSDNVSGSPGVILHSTDGKAWGPVTPPSGSRLNRTIYHEDIGFIAVGDSSRIEQSLDGGSNWTPLTYGGSLISLTLVAYDGETLVAGGQGNPPSLRRSDDEGSSWTTLQVTPSFQMTQLVAAEGLWVAINTNGEIHTSTDLSEWSIRKTRPSGSQVGLYSAAVSPAPNVAWVAVGAGWTGNAAEIFVSLAAPTQVSRTYSSEASRVTIGFAHMASERGLIASIADVCDLNWPGPIEVLGETGNGVPIRNAWYYYEITIDKTAETISIHVNNTLDLTVPMPAGVQAITEYVVTWQVENGAVGRIGDLYFLDNDSTNGETLNSRLGPVQIPTRYPDADVLTEWQSTEDELTPHWTVVGTPPDDERYVYSNLSGEQDLFTSATELPAEAGTPEMPIIAVGMVALASKSDVDARLLGFVLGDPEDVEAEQEIIDTDLTLNPQYRYAVFEKAPGNEEWDAENLETMPFGVVVRP